MFIWHLEKTYNIEVQAVKADDAQSFNEALNSDYAVFNSSLNDEDLEESYHEYFECKAHLNDEIDEAALQQHN